MSIEIVLLKYHPCLKLNHIVGGFFHLINSKLCILKKGPEEKRLASGMIPFILNHLVALKKGKSQKDFYCWVIIPSVSGMKSFKVHP